MQIPQTEVIVSRLGAELARRIVTPGEYVMGRELDADFCMDTPLGSRHHARLTVNFDEWLIEDLGSANGTFINDLPLAPNAVTRVFPTQTLRVGDAHVSLRRVRGGESPEVSLAPGLAAGRTLLPPEVRERRYTIGEVVAQGGMGAILSAQDRAIRRGVAMKVMLQTGDPGDLARFVEEAQITGRLEHPNIVPIYELGVDEQDQFFYTMKFVRGITLRKVLELIAAEDEAAKKYPLGALLTIFQKVCDAVAFAHAKGVIHRDLKPDNIMLGDFGEVLVMDWGLAKVLGKSPQSSVLSAQSGRTPSAQTEHCVLSTAHSVVATLQGSIMGTPQYMAPEQARGEVETMDQRADIYALGAILYHLLALRPSVAGADAMQIVLRVATGDIDPLTSPAAKHRAIPDSLAAVCRKAMAVDPAQRYAEVAGLQADLAAYQGGFATGAEQAGLTKQLLLLVQRHRGVFGTAFAALLLLAAMGAWFILSVTASERRATHSAELARASEKVATEKQEATRRALAKSEIAVADAAYRSNNATEMRAALQEVPQDLRDADWSYLFARSDASIASVREGTLLSGIAAHPREPGVFAVGGQDGKITILRARSGGKLLEFAPVFSSQNQPGGRDYRIAFSPDGERLAIGHNGKGILIYDARDGTKLAEWESHVTGSLRFTPDGKQLLQQISEHPFDSVALWDAASGQPLWSLWDPDIKNNLTSPVLTPDGRQIVSLRAGVTVVLSTKDGAILREFPKSRSAIRFAQRLAVAPGGKIVVVASIDGEVLGLSLEDGSVLFKSRVDDARISQIAFTPGGSRFVSIAVLGDGRQSIQLWQLKTGRPLGSLLGGRGDVVGMSIHPLSGELLVTGKESRLWSVATAPEIWTTDKRSGSARFWGSDDTLFCAKKGTDGTASAELWDLRAGTMLWEPSPRKEHEWVTVSGDGQTAAIPGSPLQVLRWADGKPVAVATNLATSFHSIVRLSQDGGRVIIREPQARQCIICETVTGTKICDLSVTNDTAFWNDLAWVAGGTRIVGLATMNDRRGSPNSQEKMFLWDAVTGRQIQSVLYAGAMDVLAVSPDGRSFAEAGAEKLVRVRDSATLAIQRQFRVHDDRVTVLAWHPTKALLATGSADFSIKIWNLETGRSVEEFRGLLNYPNALSFSPGGTRLACSVAEDGTHVWEPRSLQETP